MWVLYIWFVFQNLQLLLNAFTKWNLCCHQQIFEEASSKKQFEKLKVLDLVMTIESACVQILVMKIIPR